MSYNNLEPEIRVTCRQCGKLYDPAANSDVMCRKHTGKLGKKLTADGMIMNMYTCCKTKFNPNEELPGCTPCPHKEKSICVFL